MTTNKRRPNAVYLFFRYVIIIPLTNVQRS